MPQSQARWDGWARRLLDQAAAEGGTAQPASLAHASIVLDQGHGKDAGLLLECQ
jgi:hypothetical protein